MISRWYSFILILALALLGASVGDFSLPNQEIVVQYQGENTSSQGAETTLAIVKKQLHELGAENIQVLEEDGKLTITYYSEIDIAGIQEIFFQENGLSLHHTAFGSEQDSQFPSSHNYDGYQLNVSEIQTSPGTSSMDLDGLLVEFKAGNDRYFHLDVYVLLPDAILKEHSLLQKVILKAQGDTQLILRTPAYKIPEVRAGPLV